MKLKQIVVIYQSLQALCATKMPASVGFRVVLQLKLIKPIVETFEEERAKLFIEFGELNGHQTYTILPENLERFNSQMIPLLEQECDINFTQIQKADFGDTVIEPMHLDVLLGVTISE